MKQLAAVLLVVSALVAVAAAQSPSDWPQWRGPNRDAAALSVTPPAAWPEQLTQRWKVEVGLGYATPLLVGNRLYMFARQGETESMTAIDAATGAVLWRTGYPATFTMNSGASVHGPGPKSTPVFFQGKLFAIGMTGIVTAFDAATGRIAWQKPGSGVVPTFTSHAFSPIVDRGLVIFHVGGNNTGALTAFDANTGDVKWRWDGDGPAYASPIVATFDGTRQIVTLTQKKFIGVDAATGALLWERPYATPSVTNAQTPNLFGNKIVFGDTGSPVQAFTPSRSSSGTWSVDVAWENADVPMRLSNAVLAGDTLYGLSTRNAGQYFALDANTGKTLWTSEPRQATQAALVRAGDLIFSLEGDGDLVIMRASKTAFDVVHRYKVAETDTWTAPVLSGSRAFIKDVNTLALWTWAAGTSQAADAAPGFVLVPGGRFQMGCVPVDTQCLDNEKPRHAVDVAEFSMMTDDVTVGMYRAYSERRGKSMLMQPEWNSSNDRPVVNVSWADADAFCRGIEARLPTEAEWEYAARAGVDGAIYAWGNSPLPVVKGRKMANVADESARKRNPALTEFFAGYDDGFAVTSPVGSFPANAFGLRDMTGNVWHWTSSLDRPYPYRADDGRENPKSADRRILRGGSWTTVPRGFRVSYRVRDDPRDEDDYHGFRCAKS